MAAAKAASVELKCVSRRGGVGYMPRERRGSCRCGLLTGRAHPRRRHVFGLKASVANNIHYVDDHTIAYPAGHSAVLYNMDTRQQEFRHCSPDVDEITAMALTPNKRCVPDRVFHMRGAGHGVTPLARAQRSRGG